MPVDNALQTYLTEVLNISILLTTPLSGGDISDVWLIETRDDRYLAKVQSGANAPDQLEAEYSGLKTIAETNAIRTPQLYHCGTYKSTAILVMEYIPSMAPATHDFRRLGQELAALHQVTASHFGLDRDNFIGILPQKNTRTSGWSGFYLQNRLLPQIAMACDAGRLRRAEVPDESTMVKVLENMLADVRPALLHGDLWSGNYLISTEGVPYLIDPSVYYGHREVDLAMSRLFGGFQRSFYEAYADILPPDPGWEERNDLYQLYYLLVHLNLFGASYRPAVLRILDRYFL